MSSITISNYFFLDYKNVVPAGKTAFDSSTSCVVRNDERTDCGAWGSARLKLDLVAISQAGGD